MAAEKSEGHPLLGEVDINGEITLVPKKKGGVFLSYKVGAAVALGWLASLGYVARTKVDVLELSNTDEPGSAKADPNALSMMKRTHLSINAIKEGQWLEDSIGFGSATDEYWVNSSGFSTLSAKYGGDKHESFEEEALKGHGHDSMDICAARAIFGWTDESKDNLYNWHEFQGSQTPTGPLSAEYWWDLIYRYNTETPTSATEDIWNTFLHRGQHMYVQDLSKHMAKFVKDDTPHLARHYKAVTPGDEDKTMYVVFVPNAFNGHVVIIHAKDVSTAALKAKFTELEDEACPYAVALPYSTDRLDQWWDSLYVHTADEQELPKPMPVMDSVPTFDVEEVQTYFETSMKIHTHGATTELHDKSSADLSCKVYTVQLATQFQTAFELRFVYTPQARNFDEVGRFHKYIDEQVRSTAGINTGYSRWMDDHVGFMLKDGHTLDELRFELEAANTPYHAHVTELVTGDQTAGSLWAWGVSGLGIEWHGAFDYTTFHKPIGGFDFCTADTSCQPQDVTCLEVSNITGTNSNQIAGATSVGPFDPDGGNGGNTGDTTKGGSGIMATPP